MLKTLSDIRREFPIFNQPDQKPICYLDSAATAQKPQCVIDAMSRFYERHYASVHRGVYRLAGEATSMFENCRLEIARFLNIKDPDEVIFTRGTTDSLNLLAQSYRRSGKIGQGDEIIVSPLEHHANLLPWQLLAQETKAQLKAVKVDQWGRIDLEDFKTLCNDRTCLICISHMSNVTGAIYPVKEMARIARLRSKALVVVDGAQSAPHMLIDLPRLDCDFFAFSGHKLYGPTGVGILWGKMEHLKKLPPAAGGGHIVENVEWNQSTYGPPPARFEPGTPMIAEVIGLHAAVNYIQKLDKQLIADHEGKLTKKCLDRLREIEGLRILGEPDGPIVSFVIKGVHALDIASWLDTEGICIRSGNHCAQPAMRHFGVPATARISMGIYNTLDEIEQTISSLKQGVALLRT